MYFSEITHDSIESSIEDHIKWLWDFPTARDNFKSIDIFMCVYYFSKNKSLQLIMTTKNETESFLLQRAQIISFTSSKNFWKSAYLSSSRLTYEYERSAVN